MGDLGYGFGPSFGPMHSIMPLMLLLIFGIILVRLCRGLREWNSDRSAPRLTVPAAVVTKRADVTRHHHYSGAQHHRHTSTAYYVTFQVDGGDRMELSVSGSEYGLLAEGDRGSLTFQGTRYLDFQREV